jgi:hypothetical protein
MAPAALRRAMAAYGMRPLPNPELNARALLQLVAAMEGARARAGTAAELVLQQQLDEQAAAAAKPCLDATKAAAAAGFRADGADLMVLSVSDDEGVDHAHGATQQEEGKGSFASYHMDDGDNDSDDGGGGDDGGGDSGGDSEGDSDTHVVRLEFSSQASQDELPQLPPPPQQRSEAAAAQKALQGSQSASPPFPRQPTTEPAGVGVSSGALARKPGRPPKASETGGACPCHRCVLRAWFLDPAQADILETMAAAEQVSLNDVWERVRAAGLRALDGHSPAAGPRWAGDIVAADDAAGKKGKRKGKLISRDRVRVFLDEEGALL